MPKSKGGIWRQFSYEALPPDNLDPHQSAFGPMWGMWSLLFSKLLSYDDPNNEALSPDLAAAMPEQPDQLTYNFKLNPNAKWASNVPVASNNPLAGKKITSADVKFSLMRQANTMSPRAGNYPALLNFLTIDSITTPDDATVTIKTKAPVAPFLDFLAGAFGSIISQSLVDQASDEMNAPEKLIGSGPFVLQEFTPLKVVRVRKNPDWHLANSGFAPGRPFIDGIDMTFEPQDDNAIEGAFKAKQVDFTDVNVQTNGARINKETAGTQLILVPVGGQVGAIANVANGPFKDDRVRRAWHIAVDKQALGTFIYQGSFKVTPPVTWVDTRWALPPDQLAQKPGYRYANQADRDADIQMAKQLLQAAGGTSALPNSAKIMYSNTPAYLAAYFPQLQKNLQDVLGVSMTGDEDTTGYTKIIANLLAKQFDVYWSYGNGAVDIDDWLYVVWHSNSPYNFQGIADDQLDGFLDKQRSTFDYATRRDLGYQAQNLMLDKAYNTSMVGLVDNFLAWNYVHNVPLLPWFNFQHLWANVWLDNTDPTWQGRPA
jgi:peptide/nickel transport system substrate-binding protein